MIQQKNKLQVEYECKKCNHAWIPRGIKKPISCPRCKRYDWDKETENQTH